MNRALSTPGCRHILRAAGARATGIFLSLAATTSSLSAQAYVQQVEASPEEPDAEILGKAASIVPSPRQLAYHRKEFLCFIHFGPNTFTGREWGSGTEAPETFAPTQVDTDQWCRHIRAAGMTQVVITVKHHDGYCTWQTRYNRDFSVHRSPWKGGRGDVLRQLADSCRKYHLKLGVYVSPADLYQIEHKDGLYGNLSKPQKSIIPTDPAQFQSKPTTVRRDKPASLPVFEVEVDDYNRYMLNQLYEVLTEYGPIHEVWFDGAHPKRKGNQQYDQTEWFRLIRALAPEAVIFGGPDIRWCGNEAGNTRESEWNVLPMVEGDRVPLDVTQNDLASDRILLQRHYDTNGQRMPLAKLAYKIPEVDTSIRHGWFWRDDSSQQVRTADTVFDIYERAVGGNATLLLNVPPNRDGRFSDRDVSVLNEVGRRIRNTYTKNLLEGNGSLAAELRDQDLETHSQAKGPQCEWTIEWPEPRTLNRFVLQEAIANVGQRVRSHALDAWVDGQWQEVASGTTVGYKRILRFATIRTSKLRLRITDSRMPPAIAELGAYFYQQPPLPVRASRSEDGKVTLALDQPVFHGKGGSAEVRGLVIRYTLDGTEPGPNSPLYNGPLPLPGGGLVKARSFSGDAMGDTGSFRFGIHPDQWVISASSEHDANFAAGKAFDGDPQTFWHSSWAPGHPTHPITLTVDMKTEQPVSGFCYLPRQDRPVPDSRVEAWRIGGSRDGEKWVTLAEGEFGNLVNDPGERQFLFPRPVRIRHFRFVSLRGCEGKPYAGAAEIQILGAP